MEWFNKKTAIAGIQIPNWGIVALDQKRPNELIDAMSALAPKADVAVSLAKGPVSKRVPTLRRSAAPHWPGACL
jgi:hypothetical protein